MSEFSPRLQEYAAFAPSGIAWRLNNAAQPSAHYELGRSRDDFVKRYGGGLEGATAQVQHELERERQGNALHFLVSDGDQRVMAVLTVHYNEGLWYNMPKITLGRSRDNYVKLPRAVYGLSVTMITMKDPEGRYAAWALQEALGRLTLDRTLQRYAYLIADPAQAEQLGPGLEQMGLVPAGLGRIAVGQSVNSQEWPASEPHVLYANTIVAQEQQRLPSLQKPFSEMASVP